MLTPGYCECGCGTPTKPAKRTSIPRGHVRGKPYRFAQGHNARINPPRGALALEHIERDCGYKSLCWIRPNAHLGRYWSHREHYQRLVGPVPEGLELDHLCRNPACVNPAHLEPVTHAENIRRAPHVRLTVETAAWVKTFASMGFRKTDIARFYGCHVNTVHGALRGETWADVLAVEVPPIHSLEGIC